MKRIIFMGTPDFAVPVLRQLVDDGYQVVLAVTQPDRPKGRKKVMTPPPVKVEAEKLGIPVYQPEKIKNEYQYVLDQRPDLIVTAAFGQILPKALLDYPAYGCINVHASLLPELRGGAPIQYAILQGKTETGITIMYMVEKLDAGAILTQRKVPIDRDDHVGTLHDKLSEAGAWLLSDTLPKLLAGELQAIEQDETKATFAPNIKRDDEKIDWTRPMLEIYNQIRGLHPWPVAFTTYKEKIMKIWWAEPIDRSFDGEPGEIVDFTEDGMFVVCGDMKAVKVTSLQPAGKKRMETGDFLRGIGSNINSGEKLGEENG
ncbi:methionyl-tRNA formyltransferase [Sediminibacillus halophilus]|uniref:Methionyl-tRNA formyltransferase n=1 Tax=Sediminibacillus halophilus TaxID=482461 RepID=A0A1G9MPH2_9BACI|nr:methionyl-tRNA formyltransferase [Sediminibacillus halophilus]SDL75555.1 methionyl-tRNA formyltransferase [Sediminibacillus halophilus]